jgi:hypothetical protein
MLNGEHDAMITQPVERQRRGHKKKVTLFSTLLLRSFHSTEGKGRKEARCKVRQHSNTLLTLKYGMQVIEAKRSPQ